MHADAGPFAFPEDFLWGAATSAHQVEGGNRWNDWWEAEQGGRLPHASGEACGQYERFREDFDLARSLGHSAHRLSLEWSRIEPEDGRWDDEALEHYRAVLDALRERSLEPLVTLHHFTNPAWFARGGGWLRRDAPERFARYAGRVMEALGDRARYWITLNEPTVLALHGYVLGEWPPFRRRAWLAARRALRGMARAHVAAAPLVRAAHGEARVGLAHSAPWIVPCDPHRRRDRAAAALRDRLLNRDLLRRVGRESLDFLGINYYTRTLVRSAGWGPGALVGRACKDEHHADLGPPSAAGWEIFPAGLGLVLRRFAALGLPLIVTENGIATEDEGLRRRFLREHLAELARALAAGVDVRGYLWWSLVDNFEWALGTTARYGLCAVDFATQERSPRPLAADLARVARSNRLDPADA